MGRHRDPAPDAAALTASPWLNARR